MKKLITSTLLAVALCAGLFAITGCKSTTTVGPDGVTNVVKTVDPVRLQQARDAIEPAASSALRRAIRRSPQHADQIADYAKTIGGIFCQMAANRNFSVDYLIDAANAATAKLQDTATDDIIDGKNAAIAIYKIFAADQLTWSLPENERTKWLVSFCELFCNSITQALKDSGLSLIEETDGSASAQLTAASP